MKTTSFEISKKLAEIGFKAEAHHKLHCFKDDFLYSYYDLETILEALPKEIERDNGFNIGLRFWWADGASWIGYQNFSGFIITVYANQNELLADTAARLLILLHEEGIVNFNEGIK
jgi:hypothetical protein